MEIAERCARGSRSAFNHIGKGEWVGQRNAGGVIVCG